MKGHPDDQLPALTAIHLHSNALRMHFYCPTYRDMWISCRLGLQACCAFILEAIYRFSFYQEGVLLVPMGLPLLYLPQGTAICFLCQYYMYCSGKH